jgi:hypothetical protein
MRLTSILLIFVMILLFLMPEAEARRKARAFSFWDDGGKQKQAQCDTEGKVPRRLKRVPELARFGDYLGSEQVERAGEKGAEVDAWKHFYRSQSSCNSMLMKRQGPGEST